MLISSLVSLCAAAFSSESLEQVVVDEPVARAAIAALEGTHWVAGLGWPQLSAPERRDGDVSRFTLLDAFGRRYAEISMLENGTAGVTFRCVDLERPGTCRNHVWPHLLPDATAAAETEAQRSEEEARARARDADIAAVAAAEQREREFVPYFSAQFAAAGELGFGPDGVVPHLWLRGGVRRQHGSFWASAYALQLGGVMLPQEKTPLFEVALPVKLELHYVDAAGPPSSSRQPALAGYLLLAPELVINDSVGLGARIGVGGLARLAGLSLLTELAFEVTRHSGHTVRGVHVSVGFSL